MRSRNLEQKDSPPLLAGAGQEEEEEEEEHFFAPSPRSTVRSYYLRQNAGNGAASPAASSVHFGRGEQKDFLARNQASQQDKQRGGVVYSGKEEGGGRRKGLNEMR